MQIIPAIDIQEDKVVRLFQGDFGQQTIYSESPIEIARLWQKKGAQKLHIIDLDGARVGSPQNIEIIKKITALGVPLQVGGGIRGIDSIDGLISSGVVDVILGTVALEESKLLKRALGLYGSRIIVSIDVKNGRLMKKGWLKKTNKELLKTIKELEVAGVRTIIYTDITKDGTLTGPDYRSIKLLREMVYTKLLIAGGICSSIQIKKLKQIGVDGIIVGKALYEGVFTTPEVAEWTPRG